MINNREINSIASIISQLSIIFPSIDLSNYLSIYIPYGPLQVSAHLGIFMYRFIYTYLWSFPGCIINQYNKIVTLFLNFLKQSWEEKLLKSLFQCPSFHTEDCYLSSHTQWEMFSFSCKVQNFKILLSFNILVMNNKKNYFLLVDDNVTNLLLLCTFKHSQLTTLK